MRDRLITCLMGCRELLALCRNEDGMTKAFSHAPKVAIGRTGTA